MRLLVDTCVWSLALRRRDRAVLSSTEQRLLAALTEAIRDGRVVIVGPIRQEILSGIRNHAQFAKTKRLLDPFPDEPLSPAHYVEAARLYNLCRHHGLECGPVDMLLLAVAVRDGCAILTSDRGLLRCIELLRAENL
jgi:predicted nucleic acid-binding protein